MTRRNGLELTCDVVALILAVAGAVLFGMSYTTDYYVFGQMQSGLITVLLGGAIAIELAALIMRFKLPEAFWPKLLTFAVTATLIAAAVLILGDRVEGIGNCIITDYDSGHGGEEAIYLSLAGAILMVIAAIYNIIGSFAQDKSANDTPVKGRVMARRVGFGISAVAVLLAVIVPTYGLVYPNGVSGPGGTGAGGTYTISFNQANGNTETMPKFQFLGGDMGGMARADSRLYVDVTLTLDGNGGYTVFSDCYVIEAGARAVIGDPTGLGMVLTTNAEGTYVDNGDGTVTTSAATHVVFEMQTDTYSEQLKGAVGLNVNGNDADGTYDSNDEPAVLDFVPETIWTLSDGAIMTYRDANAGGTYTISFNQANGNTETMPNYQFLAGDMSWMLLADSRLYVDVTLMLDGNGGYTLLSDCYAVEAGERAVIGDPTGLGMVLTMNATGTYTENTDGTYTTGVPTHAVFEMQTDTYSEQIKGAVGLNVNGNDADGVYDSNDEPAVLDFVPETIWTVDGSAIVTYERANGGDEPPAADGLTVTSDDGGTTITFNADGTYVFALPSMGVEDAGTYTYEGDVLTVTNSNGDVVTAEGAPLKFHYVSSMSDQLVGDFTVNATDMGAMLSGGDTPSDNGLTITSDDGGTTITFNADGTYRFFFESFGVEDTGTYTYEHAMLTVTNANGDVFTAQGDPLKFHYVTSLSPDLAGDYTVPAAGLTALLGGESGEPAGDGVVVASDDGGTTMTFNTDGTYVFSFASYGVEDAGTYTYEGGILTLTNANGVETTAQGDPLKFHYVTAVSDQLTGDFTVPAGDLQK